MDMSWPRDGRSVNDGISKDHYMGCPVSIQYPTVDHLCRRAAKIGPCLGWKRDLNRAFKQLMMDPSSWPLLGIMWRNALFFDKTAVMGCRSTSYCCQQTTNFIHHIMLNYFVANYVDDFMGLEVVVRAWSAFNVMGNLLRDLGFKEATDKVVPPPWKSLSFWVSGTICEL